MTLADTISINGAPSMAKRVWRALPIFSAASTRNEVANTAGYDERERRVQDVGCWTSRMRPISFPASPAYTTKRGAGCLGARGGATL